MINSVPVFGKDFSVSYTVRAGGVTIETASLVTARLYSTSPTQAQKEDHSNALAAAVESVTSWTEGEAAGEKVINFSAITDSSPHSASKFECYYLIVSAKLDSAGDNVFVSEEVVQVYRPDAILSRVHVTAQDLKDLSTKFDNVRTDAQLARYIKQAERRVIKRFEGKGWNIDLLDHKDLNEAVAYLAAHLAAFDLSSESGDSWSEKADDWKAEFENFLTAYSYKYDGNEDGSFSEGEEVSAASYGSSVIIR